MVGPANDQALYETCDVTKARVQNLLEDVEQVDKITAAIDHALNIAQLHPILDLALMRFWCPQSHSLSAHHRAIACDSKRRVDNEAPVC